MKFKERKRKHDDAHFPLQGRGKKANRKIAKEIKTDPCPACGRTSNLMPHLCTDWKFGSGKL